jgi:acyl carrier protein
MLGKKKEEFEQRKQSLFLKIKPLIASQLGIDEGRITVESRIAEDLGADSLDATELIMALEETFNIEILDDDAEKMKTVEDVAAYLAERVKE